MQQNIFNLLVIILGASSAFIITPCQAQTPGESNREATNNLSSISLDQPPARELSNLATSSSTSKSSIVEANNSSASNASITATKPKPRIPIFSRVFPAPSMQQ
ncbi:hypothetical protein WKK05_07915 [Nostoc sp. UHCC 0302]|uniref:hypothetical protein n=1 Tax=Nostoc sp. UHCC 0302 TaxID=3134896 RepID=UPI00311CD058